MAYISFLFFDGKIQWLIPLCDIIYLCFKQIRDGSSNSSQQTCNNSQERNKWPLNHELYMWIDTQLNA